MSDIHVECYSGYRAEERPLRFVLRGRAFEVQELDGRWFSPDASYFRVLATDGNYYVLRHDEAQDFWTLDAFRAAGSARWVHVRRANSAFFRQLAEL
ncbi:MAG: hypothetical protein ACLP3K_14715 [Candidatus Acidiferrales bacterium]